MSARSIPRIRISPTQSAWLSSFDCVCAVICPHPSAIVFEWYTLMVLAVPIALYCVFDTMSVDFKCVQSCDVSRYCYTCTVVSGSDMRC
jgi:hypothetical protein